MVLWWQSVALGNPDFIATVDATIDAGIRSSRSWCICFVKIWVLGQLQVSGVLVKRHVSLPFGKLSHVADIVYMVPAFLLQCKSLLEAGALIPSIYCQGDYFRFSAE